MLKVNGDERTKDDAVRALHQPPSFVDTLMLTGLENQATKIQFIQHFMVSRFSWPEETYLNLISG